MLFLQSCTSKISLQVYSIGKFVVQQDFCGTQKYKQQQQLLLTPTHLVRLKKIYDVRLITIVIFVLYLAITDPPWLTKTGTPPPQPEQLFDPS